MITELQLLERESEDVRAAQLCQEAMGNAALAEPEVAVPGALDHATSSASEGGTPWPLDPENALPTVGGSTKEALVELEHCAKALDEMQRAYRIATLGAVAIAALTATEAIVPSTLSDA